MRLPGPAEVYFENHAGVASMRVEYVAGQTAVTSVQATAPLKILTPRARGECVWACQSSFGGGMVGGDTTSLDLELGERSCCYLTTQAATKIYRNPQSKPCGHRFTARLGSASTLIYWPDPVQAFAGSSYEQRQTIHLAADASLVLVDAVTSGRIAMGERWSFRRYASRTEIFVDDERVFLDSLLLDQEHGALGGRGRMDRFNCLALAVIVGPRLRAESAGCLEAVGALPFDKRPATVVAASPIRYGALVRLAGPSIEEVTGRLRRFLDFVPAVLDDDPWIRKF